MMYLIRKTGEGKSLVMHGMALMLKGITVSVVPLLSLGSVQEDKCNVDSIGVESYNLNEFWGSHADLLHARITRLQYFYSSCPSK
jgi:superfamily II DNA helicase RecQ